MTVTAIAPDDTQHEDTTMTDTQPRIVAPLSTTMWIPTMGTLVWLAPLWAVTAIGNGIALWAIARWGSIDQSLWLQAFAGWQRWPVAATGFMMVAVFLPLFVTNGATRRRLNQSALVTMGVIVTIVTAVVAAGFAVERLVYDRQDWLHAINADGTRTVSDIGYPTIVLGFLLGLIAWFIGGWLVAAGAYRFGWLGVPPAFIAAVIPIAAVEFLVFNASEMTQFDFLDNVGVPSMWIGVPVAIGVLVLAATLTARLTRSVVVE
jgi:hypothetical protein